MKWISSVKLNICQISSGNRRRKHFGEHPRCWLLIDTWENTSWSDQQPHWPQRPYLSHRSRMKKNNIRNEGLQHWCAIYRKAPRHRFFFVLLAYISLVIGGWWYGPLINRGFKNIAMLMSQKITKHNIYSLKGNAMRDTCEWWQATQQSNCCTS